MKPFKVAFQMDPLNKISQKTDSTLMLMVEAYYRGFKLFHYQPKDLFLENNKVKAFGYFFKIEKKGTKYLFKKSNEQSIDLENFNVILIRQDPPFDLNYITSTYFLEKLNKKVLIVNNPSSIRNHPEKLSMFEFKKYIINTLVSSDIQNILKFHRKNKISIIKPLYGNGGEGIQKISNNICESKRIINTTLKKYKYPLICQKFIKDIKFGDRRIIFINSNYEGSVARIPKKNSIKANFHAGGIAKKTGLVFRDKKIISAVSKFLKKNDIFFAGIDIIGNYLTEINITSPTGIQEINRLNNFKLEKIFWNKIQIKIK